MSLGDKKLQAFTLLELITVLILSGIVTLMAYSALNIIRSYYHNFREKELSKAEISKLAMIIDQDFQKAKGIVGDESKIILNFQTHEVTYQFMSDYILRVQFNAQDTFHLTTHDLTLKRTGGKKDKNDNLINELQLVAGNQDSIFFHFNKNYDAATLFRIQLEN